MSIALIVYCVQSMSIALTVYCVQSMSIALTVYCVQSMSIALTVYCVQSMSIALTVYCVQSMSIALTVYCVQSIRNSSTDLYMLPTGANLYTQIIPQYLEFLSFWYLHLVDSVANRLVSNDNLVGLLRFFPRNVSSRCHSNPVHPIIVPVTNQNA